MFADTDVAWAAGIMDGEGCIGVYSGGADAGLRLTVQVGNTDLVMITKLHDMFGGYVSTTMKANKSGKPYYMWRAASGKGDAVLRQLLPYLVTKRQQAEVALTFCGSSDVTVRQDCAQQLRDLKKVS